ncbi:uncharacterized protein K452DRAFT_169922 [Aplosporella prunicola CBS 121167]|uniref:Uncharacterized protein n=1 Tax=Aplosporella prunicola CBS 121167 TaxID=1176127 RepID=A0A6A6BIX7_9PEZI|nr:uncharacterized protein K452DRAFT_169922 [Aplosporella prunicola CBS 121167]KAF2143373.1 hypothetical protein K452DRAFT_169922 [Aplosporella prunicola CBS 121167]
MPETQWASRSLGTRGAAPPRLANGISRVQLARCCSESPSPPEKKQRASCSSRMQCSFCICGAAASLGGFSHAYRERRHVTDVGVRRRPSSKRLHFRQLSLCNHPIRLVCFKSTRSSNRPRFEDSSLRAAPGLHCRAVRLSEVWAPAALGAPSPKGLLSIP